MRVTNSMLVKDMLWNANNNLVSMSKKQTELSTGKKIHRPSDDPVGITQVLKYKTDIREAAQYQKNIDDALGWLEVSESAVMNIKEILQRVRELTVQAANGTNTADDRKKIKVEVEELTKEIIVSGNATSAGRYVFSGMETNRKLFNDDGTYNIDMTSERADLKKVIGYEVAVGEVMTVGTHPVSLFGSINVNNFFEGLVSRSSSLTTKATQATLSANVNINFDYSAPGNVLDVQVGGTTYNVDESLLANTPMNPMTKERLIDGLKSATDGTNTLSEVADIYFDLNDQLTIRAKNYGSATTITNLMVSAGVTGAVVAPGVDGVDTTITGAAPITDADVATAGALPDTKHTLVIQVDDTRANLTIDMAGMTTVAQLQTAIQTQLDASFPVGTVTVNAVSGLPISFTLNATNDGVEHKLSTDFIVSQRSELVTKLQDLITAMNTNDSTTIQNSLAILDVQLDRVLTMAGEIGGKTNRVEFIKDRVEENEITFTSLLSKVQDVDMAEAIMYFKNLENIYRASLSVGSKVIQPSLVDFIR